MREAFTILILLLINISFLSCNDESDPSDPSVASYEVTFDFHWNSENFPDEYPSGSHFSPLIGWSHRPNSEFFQPGTNASDGIKRMAETGGTSTLRSEIEDMINSGLGRQVEVGSGLGDGTGQITVEIEVDSENSAVTLSTMIAPSPDWYVAVVNVNLLENSNWVESKTVQGMAYDAGTDSGVSYRSANLPTDPKEPIMLIMDAPLGNGSTVTPDIATITFTRK